MYAVLRNERNVTNNGSSSFFPIITIALRKRLFLLIPVHAAHTLLSRRHSTLHNSNRNRNRNCFMNAENSRSTVGQTGSESERGSLSLLILVPQSSYGYGRTYRGCTKRQKSELARRVRKGRERERVGRFRDFLFCGGAGGGGEVLLVLGCQLFRQLGVRTAFKPSKYRLRDF